VVVVVSINMFIFQFFRVCVGKLSNLLAVALRHYHGDSSQGSDSCGDYILVDRQIAWSSALSA
jgi:hypothetical protein